MPLNKRYSSCDACHRSRIGCNASSQPGRPCHNCVRRNKACTFTRSQTGRSHIDRKRNITTPKETYIELQNTTNELSRTQEATHLHHILWDIFAKRLEPRIGLWISAECCPFFIPSGTNTTLISKLMVAIDAACGPSNPCNVAEPVESISRCSINRSLMSAVYAYSVRWIFLDDLLRSPSEAAKDKVRRDRQNLASNLWTQAQRWLSAALSTPCYRSILALHLLGNAAETGVRDRHGVGSACLQASLNHLVYLRSQKRRMSVQTNPFSALTTSNATKLVHSSLHDQQAFQITTQESDAMENLAYWFGAVADTSRAVFQYSPTILFPGSSGEEKVWSIVRRKISHFDEMNRQLHEIRAPLSDKQVIQIIQNAFASKMYCWAAIARVQDSVLHNTTSTPLNESLTMIQQANNQFEDIFTHLLDLCRRDFMLLSPTVQMSYTLVNIHFQVGSLILADIIPEPPVFYDSGGRAFNLRICACRSIVNAVSIALQADKKATESSDQSILLLDPYPEYIIDALIRTGSSLVLLYNQQHLKLDGMRTMFHPILSALQVLSEVSNTAKDAMPLLEERLASIISPQPVKNPAVFDHTVCSGQLLEQLEHQVATDPCLITKCIERTESDIFLSSILDTDLETMDFEALAADYTFEALSDSFAGTEKAILL